MLLLRGTEWLLHDHVYILSSGSWSRAACYLLYQLLQHTVKLQLTLTAGQPHLLQYDFNKRKDVDTALNDLSQAANNGSLYVIADEAGPDG